MNHQDPRDQGPPGAALLWVARHRTGVRIACAVVVIICAALAIDAAATGAGTTSVVLAVAQALIWCGLGIVWGVLYPSKIDDWERRHGDRRDW